MATLTDISVGILLICCISCGHSLQCYYSDVYAYQAKVELHECNETTADAFLESFVFYHPSFKIQKKEPRFECIYDRLSTDGEEDYYEFKLMGCIYESNDYCSASAHAGLIVGVPHYCYTCTTDLCNWELGRNDAKRFQPNIGINIVAAYSIIILFQYNF